MTRGASSGLVPLEKADEDMEAQTEAPPGVEVPEALCPLGCGSRSCRVWLAVKRERERGSVRAYRRPEHSAER